MASPGWCQAQRLATAEPACPDRDEMSTLLRRLSSSLRAIGSKFSRSDECRIIIVGLDNSGKTTIINFLKNRRDEDDTDVVPTVGYSVETFRHKSLTMTVHDMSGQGKYRNLWEKQYSQIHGVVFVIDSTDRMRLCVARDELEMLRDHAALRSESIPILFLANKRDDPNHITPAECVLELGLEAIAERPWFIVGTNAKTGDGLEEAFDWLADNLVEKTVEEKHK
mmetsp:Transcript_13939/g.39526  ORF Transcript_13939/g.39526 Transcript_13939/m.39526 type:complete len:224 (+) Transcript_13939:19-690(+)